MATSNIDTAGPVNGIFTIGDEAVLVTESELQFVNSLGLKNSVVNEPTNCFCKNKDKILLGYDTEIVQLHKQGDMDKYLLKENLAIRVMDCYQGILVYGFGNTLKRFDLLSNTNIQISTSGIPLSCKYSPDGKYIAVGDNNGSLVIYSSDTLNEVGEFSTYIRYSVDEGARFPFTWTPLNGLLLKGVGCIYYLDSHFKKQAEIDFISTIYSLSLYNNIIYVCTLANVCCIDLKTQVHIKEIPIAEPIGTTLLNDQVFIAKKQGGVLFMDMLTSKDPRKVAAPIMVEDEAHEDTMVDTPVDTQTDINYQKIFNGENDIGDDLNDFLDEDEQELNPQVNINPTSIKQVLQEINNQQEPYQSGTTPYVGTKRFLAYNLVGKVAKIKRQDGAFITGYFHNKNRKPVRYSDLNNYEMADISVDGLYLVRTEEPYELAFHDPDLQNDWQIQLAEEPTCISAFSGGVALCLSSNLYVFDSSGITINIYSLGNKILSTSAYDSKVFVCYSDSIGKNCYYYIDTANNQLIKNGQLPVNNVIFASFTYSGLPVVYSEQGTLLMLSSGNLWIPILELKDTSEYNEYSIWPIGVSDRFHFVACSKEMPWPSIPDAIPTSLELEMKGFSTNSLMNTMENKFLTYRMMADCDGGDAFDLKQKADKLALKLIQTACKDDNYKRVVQLSYKLYLTASFEACIKVVNYFNRPDIAEIIMDIQKENDADDEMLIEENRDPFANDDTEMSNNYSFDTTKNILNTQSMLPDVSSMIPVDDTMTNMDTASNVDDSNPFAIEKPADVIETTFTEQIQSVQQKEQMNQRHMKRMMEEEEDRKRVKLNVQKVENKEKENLQQKLNFK